MNRLLSWSLASLAFLVLTGSPSYAQYGNYSPRPGPTGPTVGPPVSPYLNLVGGAANPAVQYYLQVQPQLNRPNLDASMEQQIRNLQRGTPDLVTNEVAGMLRALGISDPLEGTGHGVRFGDASPYFRTRIGPGQPGSGYGQGAQGLLQNR
jgi:hypothetical protein